MTRSRRRAQTAALLVTTMATGVWSMSGCSRTELRPAPDVVTSGPQLFQDGVGATVTSGSAAPDQTPDGPVWWFTVPAGVLNVYNGADQAAVVRVIAAAVTPCGTPAQLVLALPNGRNRTVDVTPTRPGAVRFAVRVPARGAVDVPVQITATVCQPPYDPRTLYAGLKGLRALTAGSKG